MAIDDVVSSSEEVVLLSGFPAFLATSAAPSVHGLSHIVYTTGVTGKDHYGRFRVDWAEALADVGAAVYPHFELNVKTPRLLGPPNGISGGGLWRIRGTSNNAEIWAPSSHARLLGVPCAWDKQRTQFVEPVSLWRAWFASILET